MYSKAKIMGHPVHPMLVTFPIAFYSSTLIAFIIIRHLRQRLLVQSGDRGKCRRYRNGADSGHFRVYRLELRNSIRHECEEYRSQAYVAQHNLAHFVFNLPGSQCRAVERRGSRFKGGHCSAAVGCYCDDIRGLLRVDTGAESSRRGRVLA